MAYLQSIGAQTAIFLRTVGFGFLLGAAYEAWRFVRLLTASRRTAPWDVAFGAAAGAAAFLFALTQNGGKVRVFFLAALGVGFGVWRRFAAAPIRAAGDGALRVCARITAAVRRPIADLARRLEKKRYDLCSNLKKAVKKLQKK